LLFALAGVILTPCFPLRLASTSSSTAFHRFCALYAAETLWCKISLRQHSAETMKVL